MCFRVTSAAEVGEDVEVVHITSITDVVEIEQPERHDTFIATTEQSSRHAKVTHIPAAIVESVGCLGNRFGEL